MIPKCLRYMSFLPVSWYSKASFGIATGTTPNTKFVFPNLTVLAVVRRHLLHLLQAGLDRGFYLTSSFRAMSDLDIVKTPMLALLRVPCCRDMGEEPADGQGGGPDSLYSAKGQL